MLLALLLASLLPPTTHALAHQTIINSCPIPIHQYYTSANSPTTVYLTTFAPSTNISDWYETYPNKYLFTTSRAPFNVSNTEFTDPHLVLSAWWPYDADDVSYELYDVYGHVFEGDRVSLRPSNASCASVVWEDGVPPVERYEGMREAETVVHTCFGYTDLTLEICGTG